jgi:hypothetical protein
MNKPNRILTSLKVDQVKFEDFKVECVRDKFTLTDLVDICITRYLQDPKFKEFILNEKNK